MGGIQTEGGSFGSKLFGIFDTTGITETGMAVPGDDIEIITVATFKIIVTKIKGTA